MLLDVQKWCSNYLGGGFSNWIWGTCDAAHGEWLAAHGGREGGACKDSDDQVSQSMGYEFRVKVSVPVNKMNSLIYRGLEITVNNRFLRFLGNNLGFVMIYITESDFIHYRI